MKTLLFVKRFDLAVQACALVVPALFLLNAGQYFSALYLYLAIGSVQVASFLIHAVAGKQAWMLVERRRYGKLLAIITIVAVVVMLGISINDAFVVAGLAAGFAYLIGTPVMAVVYFLICLRETARVGRAVKREMLIVRSV